MFLQHFITRIRLRFIFNIKLNFLNLKLKINFTYFINKFYFIKIKKKLDIIYLFIYIIFYIIINKINNLVLYPKNLIKNNKIYLNLYINN